MGTILKAACKHCGKEWRCAVGSGLYLGGRDDILNAFLEKEREKVGRLFDACELFSYDFHYQPGICNCCKAVVRVPVFISISGGEKNVYVGLCPQCGKRTKMPVVCQDGNGGEETCPFCGSRSLAFTEVGIWD